MASEEIQYLLRRGGRPRRRLRELRRPLLSALFTFLTLRVFGFFSLGLETAGVPKYLLLVILPTEAEVLGLEVRISG